MVEISEHRFISETAEIAEKSFNIGSSLSPRPLRPIRADRGVAFSGNALHVTERSGFMDEY